VVALLFPKGPKGTAAVTARYSGAAPRGAAAFVAVTSQSVEGGGSMSLFSTTKGWRLGKVLKSWRRASAAARSMEVGSGVHVTTNLVELRTGNGQSYMRELFEAICKMATYKTSWLPDHLFRPSEDLF
jgi:hypothetical protein